MMPIMMRNRSALLVSIAIILLGVLVQPCQSSWFRAAKEGRFEHAGRVADEAVETIAESAKKAYHVAEEKAEEYGELLKEKSVDGIEIASEYAALAKEKGKEGYDAAADYAKVLEKKSKSAYAIASKYAVYTKEIVKLILSVIYSLAKGAITTIGSFAYHRRVILFQLALLSISAFILYRIYKKHPWRGNGDEHSNDGGVLKSLKAEIPILNKKKTSGSQKGQSKKEETKEEQSEDEKEDEEEAKEKDEDENEEEEEEDNEANEDNEEDEEKEDEDEEDDNGEEETENSKVDTKDHE